MGNRKCVFRSRDLGAVLESSLDPVLAAMEGEVGAIHALDDGEGGSAPYRIADGSALEAGAFALFYGRQTGIALDDEGDAVRLLSPDGAAVDGVAFGSLGPNASYSRDEGGVWHADWPPSPGAPNLPGQVAAIRPGSAADAFDMKIRQVLADGP